MGQYNISVFYSQRLSEIFSSGSIHSAYLIGGIVLGLIALCAGVRLYRFFIALNALGMGLLLGHILNQFMNWDPLFFYPLVGLIFIIGGIFLKSVFIFITAGIGGALLMAYCAMNFFSSFSFVNLHTAVVTGFVIFGVIAFKNHNQTIIAAICFE